LVLGFATVGLYLVYFAYRYNLLFVYDNDVDTKGLLYPIALKQMLVGIYLSQICLIVLFASVVAVGPLILTIAFTIFTALYHISLNAALDPMLKFLPKTLEAEEESLLSELEGGKPSASAAAGGIKNGGDETTTASEGKRTDVGPTAQKKPNFISKWLHPNVYTDYPTLRRLVPHDFVEIAYSPESERDAYFNPSISSSTPLLWIPRDPAGVSRQEVNHTSRVIPITDEGAHLDENDGIVWDTETGRPPIFEEKIYY
jgi:hypothetical protein